MNSTMYSRNIFKKQKTVSNSNVQGVSLLLSMKMRMIPKSNAIRLYGATIQMKATEQCFPVVLYFIMLHKVFLMFESVDETLKCYHSNESYWSVLSCGTVCYAVQDTCFKSVCRYLSQS